MEQAETFALVLQDQSLRDIIEDYEKKEKEIKELDYSNLTNENLETLKMYGQEKQLVSSLAVAYEARINTIAVTTENFLASVTPIEEFNKDIDALTGGRDEFVLSVLEKEISAPTISEKENRADDLRCQLQTYDDFINANNIQIEKIDSTPLTVADSLVVVQKVDTMLDNLKIEKNDPEEMRAELLNNVIDRIDDGSAYIISGKEEQKEEHEEVGVTISNDGYIMNTASFVTSKTAKQYAQLMREDSSPEALNTSLTETTNDISRVGGNIKLETAYENGTIENEARIPTKYEKEVVINDSLESQRIQEEEIKQEKQRQQEQSQQEENPDRSPSISKIASGVASTVVAVESISSIGKAIKETTENKESKSVKQKSDYSFER